MEDDEDNSTMININNPSIQSLTDTNPHHADAVVTTVLEASESSISVVGVSEVAEEEEEHEKVGDLFVRGSELGDDGVGGAVVEGNVGDLFRVGDVGEEKVGDLRVGGEIVAVQPTIVEEQRESDKFREGVDHNRCESPIEGVGIVETGMSRVVELVAAEDGSGGGDVEMVVEKEEEEVRVLSEGEVNVAVKVDVVSEFVATGDVEGLEANADNMVDDVDGEKLELDERRGEGMEFDEANVDIEPEVTSELEEKAQVVPELGSSQLEGELEGLVSKNEDAMEVGTETESCQPVGNGETSVSGDKELKAVETGAMEYTQSCSDFELTTVKEDEVEAEETEPKEEENKVVVSELTVMQSYEVAEVADVKEKNEDSIEGEAQMEVPNPKLAESQLVGETELSVEKDAKVQGVVVAEQEEPTVKEDEKMADEELGTTTAKEDEDMVDGEEKTPMANEDEETEEQETPMGDTEMDIAIGAGSNGDKRKRGKSSKVATRAPATKLVGDDVCFICFDGGDLVLCDRRGCTKAYHPPCVNRDAAFFATKGRWNCGLMCKRAKHAEVDWWRVISNCPITLF